MASNAFGTIFKITTWGESHGKAIGAVIDGCPAGLEITEEEITAALRRRAPGKSPYTSPREESDAAQILSGVFQGKTTGAPILILIPNQGADPTKYEPIKDLLRPGHANYTYLEKYGIYDYQGGGRASARETACRVAAAAVAEKFLKKMGVETAAYIKQIGKIAALMESVDSQEIRARTYQSPLFCPDAHAEPAMITALEEAIKEGDSLGGIVEFTATGVPKGIGDPVYEKLEGNLAKAMMGLPATKGFEIGSGFSASLMKGSEHNDAFASKDDAIYTKTNHAGGILGGIATGMPIVGRVAFKPTSSIKKTQETVTISGTSAPFCLPEGSRHDPCVAIRAVPVVEAMLALVLADAILLARCARL